MKMTKTNTWIAIKIQKIIKKICQKNLPKKFIKKKMLKQFVENVFTLKNHWKETKENKINLKKIKKQSFSTKKTNKHLGF